MLVGTLAAVPVLGADPPLPPRRSGAIVAADDLGPYIETMRQRSSTFRQQCLRLEASRVVVWIRLDPQLQNRPYRARTTIRRFAGGAIEASVAIDSFGDPTEWLAHELEHVLEQIDGIDLRDLARTRRGAWASSGDAFETTRAIQVGRAVRKEMFEARRALAQNSY